MYSLGPYKVEVPLVIAPGFYFCMVDYSHQLKRQGMATFVIKVSDWQKNYGAEMGGVKAQIVSGTENLIASENRWLADALDGSTMKGRVPLYHYEIKRSITEKELERIKYEVRTEAQLEREGRISIGV